MRVVALALAIALVGSLLGTVRDARAHEFWLEPHRYRIEAGDELVADVRNGQDYAGERFPYLPDRYRRFYIVGEDGRRPVRSRLGDVPAVHQRLDRSGDYTLALESTENAVGHETLADFREFLAYHGLEEVETVHVRLGLPERDIAEIYSRHAKTLVRVGDQDDATSADPLEIGLMFEIVPLIDPREASDGTLPITVRFRGRALQGAQVEIFHRAPDGTVTRDTLDTDARGVADIDTRPPGEYLLNAVQLIRPRLVGGAARTDAHWESLWASLTFERVP